MTWLGREAVNNFGKEFGATQMKHEPEKSLGKYIFPDEQTARAAWRYVKGRKLGQPGQRKPLKPLKPQRQHRTSRTHLIEIKTRHGDDLRRFAVPRDGSHAQLERRLRRCYGLHSTGVKV